MFVYIKTYFYLCQTINQTIKAKDMKNTQLSTKTDRPASLFFALVIIASFIALLLIGSLTL